MSLQVAPLVEASLADWTLVRAFLHMQDLVDSQGPRLTEALPTFGTLKWFLFRMNIPRKNIVLMFKTGCNSFITRK